jgi:hypothetical protein
MGTTETFVAYVHYEIGRAVGLPAVLGGAPLDELNATVRVWGGGLRRLHRWASRSCGARGTWKALAKLLRCEAASAGPAAAALIA